MIRYLKIQVRKLIIWLCNQSRRLEDGADMEEINEVTATKNRALRELAELERSQ